MSTCVAPRPCARTCRMSDVPRKVAIIGCGLIGTSIALGLREAGVTVWLLDTDAARLYEALDVTGTHRWNGEDVDLIVVAVAPQSTADVVTAWASARPECSITDVASVKTSVCDAVAHALPHARFIGGHPIAGKQTSGPQAAQGDLFTGRPWVLIDGGTTTSKTREEVAWLPQTLGARVVWLSAEEHDLVLATTSHVPQVVASAVAASLLTLSPQQASVSGPGLASVTRLAASDPDLWRQILPANAEAVAAALRAVAEELVVAANALQDGDDGPLDDLLRRGVAGRAMLGIDEATFAPGRDENRT